MRRRAPPAAPVCTPVPPRHAWWWTSAEGRSGAAPLPHALLCARPAYPASVIPRAALATTTIIHRVTPSPGDGTDHGAARSSGRARLRGLYRIIYSKTIFQHPGKEQRPATAHAGVGFVEGACVSSLVLGFRTPQTPPSPLVGEAHRGRFFGKPLRTISRFRHQNAQTPPSLLVGEGGWGDEGQKCTGMQKTAYLSQELHP
jgi:hypothetical protein